MANIMQCPICLQWLNLEFRETRIVGECEGTFLYECTKCGSVFSEDREIIWKWEEARIEQ